MNTTLAPAVAGLVVFALRRFVVAPFSIDVCGFCNGILAGLVSITAGCGAVQPWEACLIAVVGAFVYVGASLNCDEKIKVDDVVDEQSYGGSKLGVKSAKSHEPIILIASIIAIVTLAPVLLLASTPLLPSFLLPSFFLLDPPFFLQVGATQTPPGARGVVYINCMLFRSAWDPIADLRKQN